MIRILTTLGAFLVIVVTFLSSCSSGKAYFEHGNYYQAVMTSVGRLRRNPDHKKSSETLRQAYPLAVKYYEDQVTGALSSNANFKWTQIVNSYTTLNTMYDEIQRSPGALTVIPNPSNYNSKLSEAKQNAAKEQYDAGIAALGAGNREKAKEAYSYFKKCLEFVAGYRDAAQKMEDALWAATVKVMVEPIPTQSRNLAVSTDFFNNRVSEYLHTASINDYVRFFTPKEIQQMKLNPDHIIKLEFDEFTVGNVYMSEKQIPLQRDSVVVATYVTDNLTNTRTTIPTSDNTAINKTTNPNNQNQNTQNTQVTNSGTTGNQNQGGQNQNTNPSTTQGNQNQGNQGNPNANQGNANQNKGNQGNPNANQGNANQNQGNQGNPNANQGNANQNQGNQGNPNANQGNTNQNQGNQGNQNSNAGNANQNQGNQGNQNANSGNANQNQGNQSNQNANTGNANQNQGNQGNQNSNAGNANQNQGNQGTQNANSGNANQNQGNQSNQNANTGNANQNQGNQGNTNQGNQTQIVVEPIPADEQVTICHIPQGNPTARHTLTISKSALKAHLDHGDIEGSCEDPKNASKLKELDKKNNEKKDNKGNNGKGNGGSAMIIQYSPLMIASASNDNSWQAILSYQVADTNKVYATVKATLFYYAKTIQSKGVVNFSIIDARTNAVLSVAKIPGEYLWKAEWAYFNGDERALTSEQMQLTTMKEQIPPSRQDMFQAFTSPIFDQITQRIQQFYKGY